MSNTFFYVKLIAGQIVALCLAFFLVYASTNVLSNRASAQIAQPNANQAYVLIDKTNLAVTPSPTLTPTPTLLPTPTPRIIIQILPTKLPIQITKENIQKPVVVNSGDAGLSSIEAEMVALINQKRGDLRPLVINSQLVEAARRESRDNANRGSVGDCSHTGSDGSNFTTRSHDAGYGGFVYGETIGCGHASAQAIVDGWWNSPGHHAILTNEQITTIGVGWVAGNHMAQTAVVGY